MVRSELIARHAAPSSSSTLLSFFILRIFFVFALLSASPLWSLAANPSVAAPRLLLERASPPSTASAPPTAAPALHRRSESELLAERDSETLSRGRTTLPIDVSGEYLLGDNGESIEIDLEPDHLSGYVSRFGDQASDQGEPLTFLFASALLSGPRLSFLTRRVHGEWLSFSGTIVRGEARSRQQDGYYRLEGKLVLHDALLGSQQARDVSLPLAREYL